MILNSRFRLRPAICLAAVLATAPPASALRILLSNDDGFESSYLQSLFTALKTAGHDVMMSAPYRDQSGVSAAYSAWSETNTTTAPSPGGTIAAGSPGVGPTTLAAGQYYVVGTPVAAVLYGLEVLAPAKWGGPPDLVMGGPNIGVNLGTITSHSGTVGAAITALNQGVPAIAVSTANTDSAVAPLLAEIVLRVLAATLDQGKVALPSGTGLNVNVPPLDPARAADSYRCVFTRINTPGKPADSSPYTENNAFADGNTVTVSPIEGTYQAAPDKAAQILTKMRPLFAAAAPIENPKLTNLSVRGFVGTGSSVQIVGLTVAGTTRKTFLLRASGSALATFSVAGALADPLLELYNQEGDLVSWNDNWSDDSAAASALAAAASRVGAFAWTPGSPDAALLITLNPGLYSIVVRGARNTTGVALIEAYDAQVD